MLYVCLQNVNLNAFYNFFNKLKTYNYIYLIILTCAINVKFFIISLFNGKQTSKKTNKQTNIQQQQKEIRERERESRMSDITRCDRERNNIGISI